MQATVTLHQQEPLWGMNSRVCFQADWDLHPERGVLIKQDSTLSWNTPMES